MTLYLEKISYAELVFANLLIAFVTFRFFDIYKIYPINKMEDLKGSYGVILDDIVAGIYSLIILMLYKILILL